ncbi:MAG: hypothetical protein AAF226_17925, partial [Verrucomicrobiota bacterium]
PENGTLNLLNLRTVAGEDGVQRPTRISRVASYNGIRVETVGELPFVRMSFASPILRRVSLESLEDAVDKPHRLSIHDPLGVYRNIPNLRFSQLSDKFDRGYIDLNITRAKSIMGFETKPLEIEVLSGIKRTTHGAGELITSRGSHQLECRFLSPRGGSGAALKLLIAAAVAAAAGFWFASSFSMGVLLFVTSYLTCARVLFANALEVGFPFDQSALPAALAFAGSVPVFLIAADYFWRICFQLKPRDQFSTLVVFWGTAGLVLMMIWAPLIGQLGILKALAALAPLLAGIGLWGLGIIGRPLTSIFRRVIHWGMRSATFNHFYIFLAVLIGGRLLLAFIGFKEGLTLPGMRIALSVIFIPLYVILFVFSGLRFRSELRHSDHAAATAIQFIMFSGALILGFIGSGFIVSDLGAYIYSIPFAIILS